MISKHRITHLVSLLLIVSFLITSFSLSVQGAIIDDLRDEIYMFHDFEDDIGNLVDRVNGSTLGIKNNVTFNSTARWGNKGACFDNTADGLLSVPIPQADNMTLCFWYNNLYNGVTGFFTPIALSSSPASDYLNFGESSIRVQAYYYRGSSSVIDTLTNYVQNDSYYFICGGFSINDAGRSGNDTLHVYYDQITDKYQSTTNNNPAWVQPTSLIINGRDNTTNLGLGGCFDDVMVFTDLLSEAELDYLQANHLTLVDLDTDRPFFNHTLENFSRTNLDIALWSYDINATDNTSAIDTYSVNNTLFTINSVTGVLTMDSPYPVGYYPLNISINDTEGNENSGLMHLNLTTVPDVTPPVITLISPANNSIQSIPFTITFNVSDDGDNNLSCQLNNIGDSFPYSTVGLWRFEDTTSNEIFDSSGNGHHGTYFANAKYHESKGSNNTGNYGTYLDFTDYILINDSDDFSFGNSITDNPFTMGAWVYMNSSQKVRLISKQAGSSAPEWIFTTSASSVLLIYLYDESAGVQLGRSWSNAMTNYTNRWTHISAVYDGTSLASGLKLYVDGGRVDDTLNNIGSYTAMHNTISPLEIGSLNNGTATGTIAILDEAFVIDTNLTTSEIQDIMNNGVIDISGAMITYATGEFGQDQPVYINYSDTLPNEFRLQCWDMSPANNTAFIGLQYTTDPIYPVLNVTAPQDLETFPKDNSNMSINFSCFDTNFVKMNVTMYNATTVITTNETDKVGFNYTFPVDFGEGNYLINYSCFDILDNMGSELRTITVSDSPFPIIYLLDPENNTVFNIDYSDIPYPINFTFNVTKNSNCSLYLNDIYNQSIDAINNSLSLFANIPFDNTTTTERWHVHCNDGLFMTESEKRYFSFVFNPAPFIESLRFNECPQDLANVLLLIFVFMIAVGLFIAMFVFRAMFFGIMGSLIMLVFSVIFIACNVIIGVMLILLSIFMGFVTFFALIKDGDSI